MHFGWSSAAFSGGRDSHVLIIARLRFCATEFRESCSGLKRAPQPRALCVRARATGRDTTCRDLVCDSICEPVGYSCYVGSIQARRASMLTIMNLVGLVAMICMFVAMIVAVINVFLGHDNGE